MRKIFLFGALVLALLTAACGAEQGATPTLSGTLLPGIVETATAFGGLGTTTVETATIGTAETATAGLETPTVSTIQSVATQVTAVVGSPAAGTTQTSIIPVTGLDIMLVECQFCVDTLAHALLVLPDTATFELVTSTTTTTSTNSLNANCSTIEVNNGKQVVLCSGPEKTSLTLNICTNANTCTNFPVELLACPLTQSSGTAVPNKTQVAPTQGAGTGSATPTPATVSTPTSVTVTVTP